MKEQEPWVSVGQGARHPGIAGDRVYRWFDANGLPAHPIGRLWKFNLSDSDERVCADGADEDESQSGGRNA